VGLVYFCGERASKN